MLKMTTTRVDRVLVGVTGSLANLAALHVAVAQARQAEVPLVAIRAWLPVGGEIAYRRAPCPGLLQVWRQQARDTITAAFADAFGGIPDGLDVNCVLARGESGPALVAAADHANDLLVVGSRRGVLSNFRFGSVDHHCLAHARCPVLAVPPPEMIGDLRLIRGRWRTRAAAAADEFSPGDSRRS
jgi:nucleotide-binding universal stress UspA family protein